MKRFQKLTIILASLALLLMLAVGVRSSVAYFTSYAEGQGGETDHRPGDGDGEVESDC